MGRNRDLEDIGESVCVGQGRVIYQVEIIVHKQMTVTKKQLNWGNKKRGIVIKLSKEQLKKGDLL